jgi:hypothetical protein
MAKVSDAAQPWSNISRRIAELARKRGLIATQGGYQIGTDPNAPVKATAVFVLDPNWTPPNDDGFDEIIAGDAALEAERARNAAADKAREDLIELSDRLKNDGGFLS